MTRFQQFVTDIGVAFRRLCSPHPPVAPRRCACRDTSHKRTLILAHNFPQAREHARVNGLKDWVYAMSWHQIVGHRGDRVVLVRLPGWDSRPRDADFRRALRQLEREIEEAHL